MSQTPDRRRVGQHRIVIDMGVNEAMDQGKKFVDDMMASAASFVINEVYRFNIPESRVLSANDLSFLFNLSASAELATFGVKEDSGHRYVTETQARSLLQGREGDLDRLDRVLAAANAEMDERGYQDFAALIVSEGLETSLLVEKKLDGNVTITQIRKRVVTPGTLDNLLGSPLTSKYFLLQGIFEVLKKKFSSDPEVYERHVINFYHLAKEFDVDFSDTKSLQHLQRLRNVLQESASMENVLRIQMDTGGFIGQVFAWLEYIEKKLIKDPDLQFLLEHITASQLANIVDVWSYGGGADNVTISEIHRRRQEVINVFSGVDMPRVLERITSDINLAHALLLALTMPIPRMMIDEGVEEYVTSQSRQ